MRFDRPRRASGLAVLWAACALSACGGGGGGGEGKSGTQAAAGEPSSTVSAYAAQRGSAAPTVSALDAPAIADATRLLAIEDLQGRVDEASSGSTALDNQLALPPLDLAHAATLLAAARGQTASQLQQRFTLTPAVDAWLRTGSPVARQVWSQRGAPVLLSFLRQVDFTGPANRGNWQAGDIGFPSIETGFVAALAQASEDLYPYLFDTDTRLAVVDALKSRITWPEAQVIQGRFQDDGGYSRHVSVVVVTQGVVRHAGTGYAANAYTAGGRTVLAIVPDGSTSLRGFLSSGQLDQAIRESAAAVQGPAAASLPAGELRLPQGKAGLKPSVDGWLRRRGADLAYNEIQADMRGLDGQGGTYVRMHRPPSLLKVDAAGFALDSAYAAAFTYSPRNVNGPGGGGGTSAGVIISVDTGPDFEHCSPTPELRSFFLVVLDENAAVLSLAAISQVDGRGIVCAQDFVVGGS